MDQKKFRVYKSSAGSGKTFTLVREFLRLVISNPGKFRNILAITFTNKAANEMKSRIVSSLVGLAQPVAEWPGSLQAMISPLKAEEGWDEEFIRSRAGMVVKNILHNYSDLSANTIDSFMQRVIRTFSLDLNLPQNYQVELEVDLLRQRAVDRLIDQAGSDKELTELLVHYLESKTEDDKSWRIENEIGDAAKALFKEDGVLQREALKAVGYNTYNEYHKKITHWLRGFESETAKIGRDALGLIKRHGLEVTDFAYGANGAMGYFVKLADGRVGELAEPGARILSAVEDNTWATKKQRQDIKERIDRVSPQLIDLYTQSRQVIDGSVKRYKTMKLLLNHIYPLAVLGSIEGIISEIREEERLLPISEFNRIIAQVTQTETIPYIYERLGERYHHLMIDEFQDTSLLQWQNLLPLVENALSENHLNLVVGDAKQAIYRWRNGEVDQFISLPRLHGEQSPINKLREQALVSQHADLVLPVNWRSHKTIVEFNNEFFKHLSERLADPYKQVYEALNQQYNANKPDGYVEARFFEPGDEPEEKMLEQLPELIDELRSENYALRDIAILCRTNKQGSMVANHLLLQGIKVISSESLLLGNAENVRLVVSILRIMAEANDQLAYAEALSILAQKDILGSMKINDALREVLQTQPERKSARMFDLTAFEGLLQRHSIEFKRGRLRHLPLYDLAEELIRVLNLSAQNDIYLQFFLNEVHRVITGKNIDLKGFVEWWDEKGKKVSVIFPENLDAVKIMTIHKAKGLEFPVVIFPFATASQRFTIDSVWVQIEDPMLEGLSTARLPVKSLGGTFFEHIKTLEENKSLLDLVNLLYVVFTRAEERLYILTTLDEGKDTGKNSVPAFIRDFIRHTDPEFLFNAGEHWKFINSVAVAVEKKSATEDESIITLNNQQPQKHWQQKVLMSSRSHGKWFDEQETPVSFGTRIHKMLAAIRTNADIPEVIKAFELTGELAEEEHERTQKILNNIISHPELQAFFEPGLHVLPEPEILLPDGEILRPDRVLKSNDEVMVAEFKTGSPHLVHKEQLLHYMDVIGSIYKSSVKGYLIYAGEEDCTVETMHISN